MSDGNAGMKFVKVHWWIGNDVAIDVITYRGYFHNIACIAWQHLSESWTHHRFLKIKDIGIPQRERCHCHCDRTCEGGFPFGWWFHPSRVVFRWISDKNTKTNEQGNLVLPAGYSCFFLFTQAEGRPLVIKSFGKHWRCVRIDPVQYICLGSQFVCIFYSPEVTISRKNSIEV